MGTDSPRETKPQALEAGSPGIPAGPIIASNAPAGGPDIAEKTAPAVDADALSTAIDEKHGVLESNVEAGVTTIEAVQAIWGKSGRGLVIAGLAFIMIIYEIDNTTVTIYTNYSTSEFDALSLLATLGTANSIVFAVVKPPIAKISNVIGRGQTYLMTMSFYVLGYILMASSTSINTYAAGAVFYTMGQSGTNIMTDVVISDITTARWRAFAIGLSFFPFLITPWVAAFIVESVLGGIGWRWGIGMLAILMPFCASFLITTLLYYHGRAKKLGIAPPTTKLGVVEFCSQIDLGGVILFSGGLALLLLPMTLAATTPSQWKTPWLDALIALGGVLLIALPFYEKYYAKHPIVPVFYFKNLLIVMCLFLIATDSLGFSCSHVYMYPWVSVAHNFDTRTATFYSYSNGVVQCLVGIIAGLFMAYTRRYKYLAIAGAAIRLVGYGVMLRLRGAENTVGELFAVQVIQGIGSGIMQTTLLTPVQISVPHSHMAQITALLICMSFLGGSVGSCIAGGIYTSLLKPTLQSYLGDAGTPELVDSLYNSITGAIPEVGTMERDAINHAYTDVMRYMVYASLGASVPAVLITWFMPNYELPDKNNLVEE